MHFFMFSEKSMFDPILVPTWIHFGTPNPPKSNQKSIPRGIQKMINFRIDFLAKLAPCWDPSWGPRAAQDGPKTPPRRSQDAPKTAQEPQEHPRSKFGPILIPKSDGVPPPWPRFSKFLAHFNSIVDTKFALGSVESFTSNFKSQKVNS